MVNPQTVPVFILAGGLGTRLSEETHLKPKPMVEVGGVPILVHLMRSYYAHGFSDFVICAGYRSWDIKDYFLNYRFRKNHVSLDHRESPASEPSVLGRNELQEKWRVRVIDTGANTMTGGRIARALDEIKAAGDHPSNFAVTYGDGLCSANLTSELDFHLKHERVGTILGVTPTSRFGELDVDKEGIVKGFAEKPETDEAIINGGFMFFKSEFRKYLNDSEDCVLERKPLEKLAQDRQMMVFQHKGFWQCMDTLRDKQYLESLWSEGKAPWLK